MTVRRFPILAALALLSSPALAAAADAPAPASDPTPATPVPATATPTPATPAPTPPSSVPAHTPHDQTPDQVETHITTLHQQLGITPTQEKPWGAFAQLMRDNAERFRDAIAQRRDRLASMSAADNMQSYADLVTQRAQDLQALNMTFRTLYNGFSDMQKKQADTLFRQSDQRAAAATAPAK
ncbi:Spy/CpxP family protein refolding chaperone [Gluconacetobacter azotocaptans]|uniref:Spy/CpxP family protein refolding chaperone n=1 Tax=Gluconacetobacter azotocaptans TaxID=142834 RepID=UPI001959A38A|nr:Spy/CpxP family protein refolding chaperone [Gluconacetobacter azotocaptans]MBM9402303.1 Spy/CpxP family protein refolding chaperone [Gluconacetobacter azotocaptans]